jgi:predicted AlkP superfamily phosphohydrolase/phosphomutase
MPIESLPKLAILGLDGVSWSLIQRMTGEGIMPHLASLLKESIAGPMNSSLPEISPVAWMTFFSGRSPADHGIYGFTEFDRPTYNIRFNSSADVAVPLLWDWVGLKGGRSVVLNVPMTYPARPLSGVMVSGFVALSLDRAAYPDWVVNHLKTSGYRLEADFERVHHDRASFLTDLRSALAGRFALWERFRPDHWNLFTLIITDTDRLLHFFLGEFIENGPITDYFYDFFHEVDLLVGRFVDRITDAGDPTRLIMLSDHGFTPVVGEFHLNRWLVARGFQKGLDSRSKALALDPTRIYFNRAPRFPASTMETGDLWRLEADLVSALLDERAVQGATPAREAYSGPLAGYAPDLVVRPAPGFEFKAKFNHGPIYSSSLLTGTHTYQDAFYLIHGHDSSKKPPAITDILDLGRYVFSLFDQ